MDQRTGHTLCLYADYKSGLGGSLSSALSPSSVDRPYTYDCGGSITRVTPPDLGSGDTQTITVTGTGCDSLYFALGVMFTPGDPVLTKNGTPVPMDSATSVTAGDVFVLTAQSAGSGFGRLDFANAASDMKIFDWTVDSSIVNTSTTTQAPGASTTTTAPGVSTTQAPGASTTTTPSAGGTAGGSVTPAFTG